MLKSASFMVERLTRVLPDVVFVHIYRPRSVGIVKKEYPKYQGRRRDAVVARYWTVA